MPAVRTKGIGFYGVRKGRVPGVYESWPRCEEQIHKFPGAAFKKFLLEADAWKFVLEGSPVGPPVLPTGLIQSTIPVIPASSSTAVDTQSSLLPRTSNQPLAVDKGPSTSTSQASTPAQAAPLSRSPSFSTLIQPITHPCSSYVKSSSPESVDTFVGSVEPIWDVVYVHGVCDEVDEFGSMAGIGIWWGPHDKRNVFERCPGIQRTTRAQLMSILRSLELTSNLARPLLIYTDSVYSVNCFKTRIQEGNHHDWRNNEGNPIKNADLIRCISKRLEIRSGLGDAIVLAHAGKGAGIANARVLAQQGALLFAAPGETNLDVLTDILEREVNQLIVRFNRDVQKAKLIVLGPGEVDTHDLAEMRLQKAKIGSVETLNASANGHQRCDPPLWPSSEGHIPAHCTNDGQDEPTTKCAENSSFSLCPSCYQRLPSKAVGSINPAPMPPYLTTIASENSIEVEFLLQLGTRAQS